MMKLVDVLQEIAIDFTWHLQEELSTCCLVLVAVSQIYFMTVHVEQGKLADIKPKLASHRHLPHVLLSSFS